MAILLIYVIATPFFALIMNEKLFLNIAFSAVMLSAIMTVSHKKKSRIWVVLLGFVCLVFIWLKVSIITSEIMLASVVLQALFNFFMVFIIILFIFETTVITRNTISAAVVAYLFVALSFADLFLMVELISPGSFSISHDRIMLDPSVLRYFSFVTLSTLGYGDIVPISSPAKNLVVAEALIGPIYLTVLIAKLVGGYGAQHHTKKE
ncbi:MAG: two pore domain potassium channel family protein [Desulfobacteraceae bacterium]|nr:two pore domain potassium channel family protein [Desulfobacteraceae bacterium]